MKYEPCLVPFFFLSPGAHGDAAQAEENGEVPDCSGCRRIKDWQSFICPYEWIGCHPRLSCVMCTFMICKLYLGLKFSYF